MKPDDWRTLDGDALDRALERIEASGKLGERSRLRDLLRYVATEEFAGRGDRLSAYAIGIDVLGRSEDFDPNSDSIVRTEMNRLRERLDLYYGTVGSRDDIRIAIPKGSYRPAIERAEAAPRRRPIWIFAAAFSVFLILFGTAYLGRAVIGEFISGGGEGFDGPRLLIRTFKAIEPGGSTAEALAHGLSSDLTTDLTQYAWLSVSKLSATADLERFRGQDPREARIDFILTGEVTVLEDQLTVTSSLLALPDLDVVWSGRRERALNPAAIAEAQRDLAAEIAATIGSENGIVPKILVSERSPLDEVSLRGFTCLMGVYAYWETPSEDKHLELRECLETATRKHPDFAEAWAALSFIYMDEARHGLNVRPGADPWADAEEALDEALRLAPLSAGVLNAAMSLAVSRPEPDYEAFERYGREELNLRPNNSFALADFGGKLGINLGRWKEGMILHEKALRLELDPPSWYYFAPAYFAVLKGSDGDVYAAVARLSEGESKPAGILRAIGQARTGRRSDLEKTLERLATLGIRSPEDAAAYIENRRYEPDLTAALKAQIRDAFEMARSLAD